MLVRGGSLKRRRRSRVGVRAPLRRRNGSHMRRVGRFVRKRRSRKRRSSRGLVTARGQARQTRREYRSNRACRWIPRPIANNCLAKIQFEGTNAIPVTRANVVIGDYGFANPWEHLEGSHFGSVGNIATSGINFGGVARFNPYFTYLRQKYKKGKIFGSKIQLELVYSATAPQFVSLIVMPQIDQDRVLEVAGKTGDQWAAERATLVTPLPGAGRNAKTKKFSAFASSHSIFNVSKANYNTDPLYEFNIETGTPVTSPGGTHRWDWNARAVLHDEGLAAVATTVQCKWRITYFLKAFDKIADYA